MKAKRLVLKLKVTLKARDCVWPKGSTFDSERAEIPQDIITEAVADNGKGKTIKVLHGVVGMGKSKRKRTKSVAKPVPTKPFKVKKAKKKRLE